jgi:hypothetical protein
MQEPNSDFFFSQPMIFFGSFHHLDEEIEDVEWDIFHPFILDIDPKHPLQQNTGLYLHWFDS